MNISLRWAAIPLIAVAGPAVAHPGHAALTGFVAGLVHPLSGVDHLLTMVMVGLWAGIAFPRLWWVCPAAFMSFMLAGFSHGASGGAFPLAETLILASLVALALVLIVDARPPLALSAAAIALFAIGHGFAHGSEMASEAGTYDFAGGFLISTALLHGAGLAASRWAKGAALRRVGRATGMVAVLAAATMMWSA